MRLPVVSAHCHISAPDYHGTIHKLACIHIALLLLFTRRAFYSLFMDVAQALARQRLAQALARFEAFREHIPPSVDEACVKEYHQIVDDIALATGEMQLHVFKIGEDELQRKIMSVRRRGYSGRGGSAHYSDKRYVESARFQRQVDALGSYLQRQGYTTSSAAAAPKPGASSRINIGTMIGSAIQQGTEGSQITVNYNAKSPEFKALVQKIREAAPHLGLSEDKINQLCVDIGTVEVQISGAAPKHSIITESMHSIRNILEGAVGSALASGLLPVIYHYFPK